MSKRKTKTKAEIRKKKAKRTAEVNQQKNVYKKSISQRAEKEEYLRKIKLIHQIYNAKNEEFALLVDGKIVLNDDKIYEKEGILCWKNDENPILSGIEDWSNYTLYTKDFINETLTLLLENGVIALPQTPINIDDFELVVDETVEKNEVV